MARSRLALTAPCPLSIDAYLGFVLLISFRLVTLNLLGRGGLGHLRTTPVPQISAFCLHADQIVPLLFGDWNRERGSDYAIF